MPYLVCFSDEVTNPPPSPTRSEGDQRVEEGGGDQRNRLICGTGKSHFDYGTPLFIDEMNVVTYSVNVSFNCTAFTGVI